MGAKTVKKLIQENQLLLKKLLLIICDSISVYLANIVALMLRFNLNYTLIPEGFLSISNSYLGLTILVTIIIFYFCRLYASLWIFAGATEMVNIAVSCISAVIAQMMIMVFFSKTMPRSYYPLYGISLFLLVCISRYFYRAVRGFLSRREDDKDAANVLIIGGGAAGNTLIKEIINSRYMHKRVLCVIDDDKRKIGSYIHGIKIIGDRSCIQESVKYYNIKEIIVAMPSASPKSVKEILDICKETGCEIKKLPGIYQLVNGEVSISKLKEIDVNDLLGRDPVKVDLSSILEYVRDKQVLITGGGGSIGSELCRQIAEHRPSRLIILDIYENSIYNIQNELMKTYPDLELLVLIASVRNAKRIYSIFKKYRPDIVYHAAAHKHVPLMEVSPNEAVKNNVLGTLNVVKAADKYHVSRFVLISTDKAVNPTNIMGATKRICEMIVQTYNKYSKTEFVAVRFGNVLGSNGSVIPLFKEQIEQGGPVTVTHPDIIRYFMTIPEAVSLVLQTGAYAKGGEIFILDMGEPVKIIDLARNLILLSGHAVNDEIKIEFTGLRPGEKLYEEILMDEEGLSETENKLIHIGKPIEIDEERFFRQLKELKEKVMEEPDDIRVLVKDIVPTYKPKNP